MKRYIEVEPVCPFTNKKCMSDGLTREVLWNGGTAHPCAFWDESTYNGVDPQEPCRAKRAINKILSDEIPDRTDNEPVNVPWNTEKE